MFDGFLSPALLQTQQAVFQQRVRNQVVVVLDLRLAGIDAAVQREQGFFASSKMLLFQGTFMADSLAEDEGEVVLRLFSMAQVLETQSLQEADQTLIIERELISCREKEKGQDEQLHDGFGALRLLASSEQPSLKVKASLRVKVGGVPRDFGCGECLLVPDGC